MPDKTLNDIFYSLLKTLSQVENELANTIVDDSRKAWLKFGVLHAVRGCYGVTYNLLQALEEKDSDQR